MAGAAAVGMTAAFLGPAHVAAAAPAGDTVVRVPCDPVVLASDLTTAAETETLQLAHRCVYHLTQELATNGGLTLTVVGHGATLERSYAPGTPSFPILDDNSFGLITTDLNFRHGNGAIVVVALLDHCRAPRSQRGVLLRVVAARHADGDRHAQLTAGEGESEPVIAGRGAYHAASSLRG